jgi:hypothetical protein
MTSVSSVRRFATLALVIVVAMPSAAGAITRETVLRRGEVWVGLKVPYSQSGYATTDGLLAPLSASTWRRDCSGFASMCYDIRRTDGSTLSLDTASLRSRLTTFTGTATQQKSKLKPGDLILRPKDLVVDGKRVPYGHAVIFVRWVDAAKTIYVGYHESSSGKGTVAQEIRYPFWSENGFAPYRYKLVVDGRLRKSRGWLGPYLAPMPENLAPLLGMQSMVAPSPVMAVLTTGTAGAENPADGL